MKSIINVGRAAAVKCGAHKPLPEISNPEATMKKHCGTWLTDKYIAHRGLFDNVKVPENSLTAFRKAAENNFAIETDVQMTSDGRLIIFHDDTLERMTGAKGKVCDTSFEKIRSLRLLDTEEKIPTFDEFLEEVDGKTQLVIEIKTHKKVGAEEQQIYDRLKNYKGEYCVESFNPFIVRWFKKNAPEVICGQLSCAFTDGSVSRLKAKLLRGLFFCKWNGSRFIAYDVCDVANNKRVAKFRETIPVICWTVKSQEQLEENEKYFDNIIFDSFIPERRDTGK